MPSPLYIPSGGITLDKAKPAQIRLGLQGFPGTGKTWSALTFPNPVVANINRGLGAHLGRSDVVELPFYEREFTKKYWSSEPENIKEAYLTFLKVEGQKFGPDQTLISDALTDIESAYHTDWRNHPMYSSRTGKVDDFVEWNNKLTYFGEVCDLLMGLKCHVILITHESEKKDKSGDYSGKIRPLLTGQFADKIVGKFTDWFRQMTVSKPDLTSLSSEDDKKIMSAWGMNRKEFIEMCNTFPRNTIYYWQTESDNTFDGKCSSLRDFPSRIPANYQSFAKYVKKISLPSQA